MVFNLKQKRKKPIQEFETIRLNAELNVLKKESVKRKLTTSETNKFVKLARLKIQGKI